MAQYELVLCERDCLGNKTDKKLNFKTNNADWLASRAERETLKGVRKQRRSRARDQFYGGPARPLV